MNVSHLYLGLFIHTVLVICVRSKFRNPWALSNTLIVYKNLDELLSIIKKDTSPLAALVVETFNSECRYRRENKILHTRTKPFIIIEGNHKKSQDLIGRMVAKELNAKYVTHPAYCIAKYVRVLPKGSFLQKAFFHLSNYAANYYVRYRHNSTVVLNGYWMQQLAFTVNGAYPSGKLPSTDSEILSTPEDLLPPDVTFYLDMSTSNEQGPWKQRTMDVMRLLQARYPVEIKTIEADINVTAEDIVRYAKEHLRDSLFSPTNHSRTYTPEGSTESDYC